MTLFVSLTGMLVFGACLVLLISWLSRRRSLFLRILAGGIALVTTVYCFIVSFAIIAENVGAWPKTQALFVLLTFLLIGSAVAVSAVRGARSHRSL